jgi:hypothetical protein
VTTVLLGVAAFLLTFFEVVVATKEGRSDRLSTASATNYHSKVSAVWAGVFEALLLVDVVLVVYEPVLFAPPVILAAMIGKYWSLEQRRKKFRSKVKRKKTPNPAGE